MENGRGFLWILPRCNREIPPGGVAGPSGGGGPDLMSEPGSGRGYWTSLAWVSGGGGGNYCNLNAEKLARKTA